MRGSRALDRSGRPLRFGGFGLLLVDAAALAVILGYLLDVDWSRPGPANLVTVLSLSLRCASQWRRQARSTGSWSRTCAPPTWISRADGVSPQAG